ncbi:MAG: hypothetical protein ABI597_06230 [Gammaproteobacteria bacterium]
MPSLIFLTIAYQVENKKWRYFFLALAAANLLFNLSNRTWLQEIYSLTTVVLLLMLTPYFFAWWQNRNNRNNPTSLWQFLRDTYLIAKYNKFRVLSWMTVLIISLGGVYYYTEYTGYTLLSWLLTIFITLCICKKIFYFILPPEWFLHDINTGYVFLSVFIACCTAYLMELELGTNFIIPMLLAVAFSMIGFLVHRKSRYFIPGCALILADIFWQIIRFIENGITYTPQVFITDMVLIAAILIGLWWLIKKPGILPITYLALFQLFRFSAFTYQAVDRVTSTNISTEGITYYILYLVCWMYIAPLLFWFIGLAQQEPNSSQPTEKHAPRRNKLLASVKK